MPNINALLRKNPRDSRFGAPMGRMNKVGDGKAKLFVQQVNFVDGDYSPDGTYWGSGGGTLWAGFTEDLSTLVFVRALNRKVAIQSISEISEEFTFHRK